MSNGYFPTQPGGFRQVRPLLPAAFFGPDPTRRLGMWSFWMLAGLAILNLNGLAFAAFGTERVLSILMLIGCVGIYISMGFSFNSSLGRVGRMFLAFLAVFLTISIAVGIEQPDRVGFLVLEYSGSIIIVTAAAMIGRYLVLTNQVSYAVKGLFILGTLCTASYYFPIAFPVLRKFLAKDPNRFSGVFGDPNEAGVAACLALVCGFAYLVTARNRFITACAMLISVGAVIITFSRGAMINLVMLVFSQFIVSPVFKRKGVLLVMGVIVLFMGWVFLIGVESFSGLRPEQRQRIRDITRLFTQADLDIDKSTSGRDEVAKEAIEIWQESPIIGNGLGALRKMPRTGLGAHNSYLMVLGEGGAVSGIVLLLFLLLFAYEGWRCPRGQVRTFVLGYLVVFSISLMVSHKIFGDRNQNVMLGLSIGMLAGMRELQRAVSRQSRTVVQQVRTFVPQLQPAVNKSR